MSIRRVWGNVRGLALWVLVVTTALICAGYWLYTIEAERLENARHEDLASIASLKTGQILEWRRELKSDAERSSTSPLFRDAAQSWLQTPDNNQLTSVLVQRLRVETLVDFYVDALLLQPDCRIVLSVLGQQDALPPETQSACRNAAASLETSIGDLFRMSDGSIAIDVVSPLRTGAGRLFALLALRSDARSYLFPLLTNWPTPSRSAETLLVHRVDDQIEFLNELRHRSDAALKLRVPLSSPVPAAHAVRGNVGIVRSVDYRGVEVLADVRPIAGSPWFMVAKVDATEILAELRFRAFIGLAALALLALLATASLAFGYKYQQQVSRRDALEVQAARLRLLQLPPAIQLSELLERALDEAARLTRSPLGFFHTLEADGQTFELEAWYPKQSSECSAPSPAEKRTLDTTAVWMESIRQGRPVLIANSRPMATEANWPAALPILREALVPVLRDGKVTAVLAVANKLKAYTKVDEAVLLQLAELTWEIISRRRADAVRSKLEEQLRVAQRMEAIGRLAGGIAHDFNNLLVVIHSCSEFLLSDLPPGDPRRNDAKEILEAGVRAETLTRQLLAFSRKQVLIRTVFDLNDVVRVMSSMLERLIGELLTIRLELAPERLMIKADKGQIEQVITNLVVNARDAMPNGGVITIETGIHAGGMPAIVDSSGAALDRCAEFTVSDVGEGMDQEVMEKIFDPFFSTKAHKGTGLGLATVYGIVHQSGGTIWVTSRKGFGTSFRICLPLTDELPPSVSSVPSLPAQGSEKLLLVEDNAAVREQIQRMLEHAGYEVAATASADEVLAFTSAKLREFALVISDVVMPGTNGCELAERLLVMEPQLKILLMSGYTDQSDVLSEERGPRLHFISKPFGAEALAYKVREVIGRAQRPSIPVLCEPGSEMG